MPNVLSVEYHCRWFYMLLLIYFQHLRMLCMQGMESSVLHSQIKTWVAPQKIKFKLRIKLNYNIYNMWASEPARQGGLLPIQSSKWNPNNVLTTCNAIIKVLASGFEYWSWASHHKPKINSFRKEQKHGGWRRGCFSLS